MSNLHKLALIIWIFLSLIVGMGIIAFEISTKTQFVSLPLQINHTVETRIFRLFKSNIYLSLRFKNVKDSNWHGSNKLKDGPSAFFKNGILNHPEPGEPIKIKVEIDGLDEIIYETLPGDSPYQGTVRRTLYPFVDDGNPALFPWPPKQVALPSGFSHLKISVIEVGEHLLGEDVTLVIDPPLSFKTSSVNYSWLWWFFAWPIFVVILLIYLMILIWRIRVKKAKHLSH